MKSLHRDIPRIAESLSQALAQVCAAWSPRRDWLLSIVAIFLTPMGFHLASAFRRGAGSVAEASGTGRIRAEKEAVLLWLCLNENAPNLPKELDSEGPPS